MLLPRPAPRSTVTACPWATSAAAPLGVSATRFSSALISFGTPTRIRPCYLLPRALQRRTRIYRGRLPTNGAHGRDPRRQGGGGARTRGGRRARRRARRARDRARTRDGARRRRSGVARVRRVEGEGLRGARHALVR